MKFPLFENRSQLGAGILSLFIALGFAVVVLDTLIPSEPEVETTDPLDSTMVQSPQPDTNQDYAKQIAALNIFGSAQQKTAAKTAVVKKTRLQLKLLGILNAAEDEQTSLAILALPSGSEKAVRIGEQVPGGATLEEIYPTHIILRHNGQLERLDLEQKEIQLNRPITP